MTVETLVKYLERIPTKMRKSVQVVVAEKGNGVHLHVTGANVLTGKGVQLVLYGDRS